MFNIKRLNNETEAQYLWRIGQAKENGLLEMTWPQIADVMNKEFRTDESEYRTESAYRKAYSNAKKFNVDVFSKNEQNEVDDLRIAKRELEKERRKLQSEKIEYHKWLREDARDELISEKISDAIRSLSPFESPSRIIPKACTKSWVLALSDAHYGCEYEIKDFYGETVNAYSPEIFEKRMEFLFNRVVDKIEELGINELTIYELGDGVDGCMRLSQLMRLRYGIIESSIRYADYLANWLNSLSNYVRIKFQMVFDSNHNQLRLLDGKKNSFPDENVSKIMITLIKERLKNNENVTIIQNPTGMTYSIMSTYCVVGFHGEKKDLKSNLLDISRIYGVHVDYTISGHVHHRDLTEIGIDSETLSVGSIIGVDPYSMTLNASSNASCSMFEFQQSMGRTAEYVFKLN